MLDQLAWAVPRLRSLLSGWAEFGADDPVLWVQPAGPGTELPGDDRYRRLDSPGRAALSAYLDRRELAAASLEARDSAVAERVRDPAPGCGLTILFADRGGALTLIEVPDDPA